MSLKNWHCIALLFFAVLGCYCFSIHAGFNSVDDLKMMLRLENSGPLDLIHHFFPQGRSYYYRPMTTVTYFWDRDLWGTLPSFMHLENILLHFINSCLVFFNARLIQGKHSSVNAVALLAALFFVFHPLAAESVCWISGRTDLLAGVLLLGALWLLLVSMDRGSKGILFLSGLGFLLSCLAKEVAVFALPGLLWVALTYPGKLTGFVDRFKKRWLTLSAPVSAVICYFILRTLAIVKDTGVSTVVKNVVMVDDFALLNKLRIALKVYGFYFKKLFIPWPLNFGIVEISEWYVLAGVLLTILLLWLLWRRDLLGALVLTSFCVLSPAILIPFGKMAWTPIAERYLYIPVALLSPALAVWCWQLVTCRGDLPNRNFSKYVPFLFVVLLFGPTAAHRSWIWQDNERLYRDTAQKSPDFLPAKAELASALIRKGRVEEAESILREIQALASAEHYIVDDLNLAASLMNKKDYSGARELLIPLLSKPLKNTDSIYKKLLRINDKRIAAAETVDEQNAIRKESLDWLQRQQEKKPNAFTAYRIGQLQLALGDKKSALKSFQFAYERSSKDAYYRNAAETFARKIQETLP